jgi:hypothetical protein
MRCQFVAPMEYLLVGVVGLGGGGGEEGVVVANVLAVVVLVLMAFLPLLY